ncbi:MAG: hypothetical protein KDA92_07930 [Planctomycetales bacterium]|nr:hypothetical protein [Planctomycetales bacterium]
MKNLTDSRALWTKGILFLALGLLAAGLIVLQSAGIRLRTTMLLVIAIWAFCRAYYFAFYVIERYVDPSYRFAGLLHFARYATLGHSADRRDVG